MIADNTIHDLAKKIVFLFIGIMFLKYNSDNIISLERIKLDNYLLEYVIIILIPLAGILIFYFFKTKNYKNIVYIAIGSVIIFIGTCFIEGLSDVMALKFLSYYLYYMFFGCVGGYFTSKALVDPEEFKQKIERYFENAVDYLK